MVAKYEAKAVVVFPALKAVVRFTKLLSLTTASRLALRAARVLAKRARAAAALRASRFAMAGSDAATTLRSMRILPSIDIRRDSGERAVLSIEACQQD